MSDFFEERQKKEYNEYVKKITPTHSLPLNMAKAFVTGGVICVIGQGILNFFKGSGLDSEAAGSAASLCLVLLSVVLTGLNVYQKLAKFGGAAHWCRLQGLPILLQHRRLSIKRRTGIRNRVQDLYDRRPRDSVWNPVLLGAWSDLLGIIAHRRFVVENVYSPIGTVCL